MEEVTRHELEETAEPVKKRRGWPKGKSRGPRKTPVAVPTFVAAPEPEAPIHVIVHMKSGITSSFGCADHIVENGFHVFTYPSERDRYRTTRREFAISEIIEIEITAARTSTWASYEPETMRTYTGTPAEPVTVTSRGPVIHSVKKSAANVLGQLETSSGPIKMDTMPKIMFGDHGG